MRLLRPAAATSTTTSSPRRRRMNRCSTATMTGLASRSRGMMGSTSTRPISRRRDPISLRGDQTARRREVMRRAWTNCCARRRRACGRGRGAEMQARLRQIPRRAGRGDSALSSSEIRGRTRRQATARREQQWICAHSYPVCISALLWAWVWPHVCVARTTRRGSILSIACCIILKLFIF